MGSVIGEPVELLQLTGRSGDDLGCPVVQLRAIDLDGAALAGEDARRPQRGFAAAAGG